MDNGVERDIRISFVPFCYICRTVIKVFQKGHLSSLSSELMEKVLEIFGIIFQLWIKHSIVCGLARKDTARNRSFCWLVWHGWLTLNLCQEGEKGQVWAFAFRVKGKGPGHSEGQVKGIVTSSPSSVLGLGFLGWAWSVCGRKKNGGWSLFCSSKSSLVSA